MANKEGIGLKPPLALLYLATYVRDVGGHVVKVLDCRLQDLDWAQAAAEAARFAPDVVGISAWTDFWYSASRTVASIKERLPKAFVVLGGPHVLVFSEETLAHPGVDAVVVGDGEEPLLQLLDCLRTGQLRRGIPGLHFRAHGLHEQLAYAEPDLDRLPIPDRTLLPVKAYTSVLGSGQLASTMITSRGCPFKCVYCKIGAQRTASHSGQRVLSEFRAVHALGIREIEIYDDTFTWSLERVHEICAGLIAEKLELDWAIRDRVGRVDAATFNLLRQAGCSRIHFGIESGSDTILRRIRKGITVRQAEESVALAKNAGLTVLTFFMLGLPDESLEDLQQTLALSLRLPADYCQYSITMPYPGTELYQEMLRRGVLTADHWRDFARAPVANYVFPFASLGRVPVEKLLRLQRSAVLRYYFRPARLLRELAGLRSATELRRKAAMGLALLRSSLGLQRRGA